MFKNVIISLLAAIIISSHDVTVEVNRQLGELSLYRDYRRNRR